ncbi:hypothetical protein [Brevundimonas sp. LM2]|uniref:hypothetical protein n=1 Tax=Brevundimonas sp. LM2 TaxID=1938605 RepID=UPI0012378DB1|nr:hypothetical protein [Brevundimonas sp. LM2]
MIYNSNLLTVVFGAVLIFGLPEALLTEDATCAPARGEVRLMGLFFVALVFGLAASTVLFPLMAPTQFRDFANRSEYLSGKAVRQRETYKEVWAKAEVDFPLRKAILIGLLIACAALFCGFAVSAARFLVETQSCTHPSPEPLQVHQYIDLSVE